MRAREFAVRWAVLGIAAAMLGAAGCGDRDEGSKAPAGMPPPRAESAQTQAPAETAEDHETARWLPTHQCPDGHWSAEEADRWVRGVKGPASDEPVRGKASNDVAVTALATLAFLGAGYTPRSEGTFGNTVAWAVHWLSSRQLPDGSISRRGERLWATNHALATWALVEAAARTEGAFDLQDRAQRALAFAASSLRRGEPAWQAESGPGRLPPIAWLLFVRSKAVAATEETPAIPAGWFPTISKLDDDALGAGQRHVGSWVEEPGKSEGAPARTAAGIRARLALGLSKRDDPAIQAAAERCAATPPTWDVKSGSIDFGLWFVGTEAVFQARGAPWSRWNKAMEAALSDTQRKDGDVCRVRGTWDPHGPWADEGGRVFSTAAAALALELYYSYDVALGEPPDRSPTARPPTPTPLPPEPSPRVYAPCR